MTHYVIHNTKYDLIYDMTYERDINLHTTTYESLGEESHMIYDIFYGCVKNVILYML